MGNIFEGKFNDISIENYCDGRFDDILNGKYCDEILMNICMVKNYRDKCA